MLFLPLVCHLCILKLSYVLGTEDKNINAVVSLASESDSGSRASETDPSSLPDGLTPLSGAANGVGTDPLPTAGGSNLTSDVPPPDPGVQLEAGPDSSRSEGLKELLSAPSPYYKICLDLNKTYDPQFVVKTIDFSGVTINLHVPNPGCKITSLAFDGQVFWKAQDDEYGYIARTVMSTEGPEMVLLLTKPHPISQKSFKRNWNEWEPMTSFLFYSKLLLAIETQITFDLLDLDVRARRSVPFTMVQCELDRMDTDLYFNTPNSKIWRLVDKGVAFYDIDSIYDTLICVEVTFVDGNPVLVNVHRTFLGFTRNVGFILAGDYWRKVDMEAYEDELWKLRNYTCLRRDLFPHFVGLNLYRVDTERIEVAGTIEPNGTYSMVRYKPKKGFDFGYLFADGCFLWTNSSKGQKCKASVTFKAGRAELIQIDYTLEKSITEYFELVDGTWKSIRRQQYNEKISVIYSGDTCHNGNPDASKMNL